MEVLNKLVMSEELCLKLRLLRIVCTLVPLLAIAERSVAATITADPDNYDYGTILNTAFSGMTLSSVINGAVDNAEDILVTPIEGGTDKRFGHTSRNTSIVPSAFQHPHNGLRADFDSPTDVFEVTLIDWDGIGSFSAIVQAYDINDNLLEELILPWPQPDVVTATISRPGISWIFTTGYGGTGASIDLIRYSVVPVPPALWLFGSGLIGLIGIARKQ